MDTTTNKRARWLIEGILLFSFILILFHNPINKNSDNVIIEKIYVGTDGYELEYRRIELPLDEEAEVLRALSRAFAIRINATKSEYDEPQSYRITIDDYTLNVKYDDSGTIHCKYLNNSVKEWILKLRKTDFDSTWELLEQGFEKESCGIR